jgi:catechol 2,3-dioxygenase-like lactoylglutathione lyase family enzyme
VRHDLIDDTSARARGHASIDARSNQSLCEDVGETTADRGASFSHLAISVSNLDRAQEFYRAGLGFSAGDVYLGSGRRVAALMGIPTSGFRGVFLRLGGVCIELLEYRDPLPAPGTRRDARAIGYTHISLIVADAAATMRTAVEHGGIVLAQLDHRFGEHAQTKLAFLTDPDHNRIELIEHPEIEEQRAHSRYLGLGRLGWPTESG